MLKFQSLVRLMWPGPRPRQRRWARGWGGRARAAAALLLALGALCARVPLRADLRADLRAPPHELAARLADFNHLRKLYPHIESWRVESQWNNYTSLRYTLSFSCGARCAGGGEVRAHDEYASAPAPAHGRARAAAGRYRLHTCRTLPLLPWPQFCDSVEVEWRVRAGADGGAGSLYAEAARARRALAAAAPAWLRGALAAERRRHLRALQDASDHA